MNEHFIYLELIWTYFPVAFPQAYSTCILQSSCLCLEIQSRDFILNLTKHTGDKEDKIAINNNYIEFQAQNIEARRKD